jgi:hypothetical protein
MMNIPKMWKPSSQAWACVGLALVVPLAAAADAPTYYYDGGRKVAIVAQPDLVAEFGAPVARARAAGPVAQRVAGDSLVRVLKVAPGDGMGAQPQGVMAAGARSAVYRQNGTAAGRLMALPGGVLVKFQSGWSSQQIDAWLATRGLPAGQSMAIGPAWRLLPTAPGSEALALANRIQESGEVVSASPNWWTQTRAK